MLPKKLLLVFFLLFTILVFSIAWILNVQGFKNTTLSPLNFSTQNTKEQKVEYQTLTAGQIKSLAKVPSMVRFKTPLEPQNQKIAKKLEDSNNLLYFASDVNDESGRKFLVETKGRTDFRTLGFGGFLNKFEASEGGKMVVKNGLRFETGLFSGFAKIDKTEDLYMILSVPQKNREFAVRILKQKAACLPGKEPGITELSVLDISFPFERAMLFDLGPASLWNEKDLFGLFQKGDVVLVSNQRHTNHIKTTYGVYARRDPYRVACADTVTVYRFGGKKQIEKELNKTLPDFPSSEIFNRLLLLYGAVPK